MALESHHNSTNIVGDSIISFWNRNLTRILNYILLIAFYSSVFVSAFLKWKPLWKKIKLVELNLNYPITCYRRLRRETFVGLLLLFMVIPNHSSMKFWFATKFDYFMKIQPLVQNKKIIYEILIRL